VGRRAIQLGRPLRSDRTIHVDCPFNVKRTVRVHSSSRINPFVDLCRIVGFRRCGVDLC